MQEKVLDILRNECNHKLGDILLVGVSGGPDSLALVHLLVKSGFHLIIAHLDHGLREESRNDLLFVKSVAEQLGYEFRGDKVDTENYAAVNKLSLEEAARNLRYKFLFEQAKKNNCSAVVVGHTADDQVETVLMHFLRGAGLDGLSGMAYQTKTHWDLLIPLFRPLLGVWRSEILTYCEENNLNPKFDRSNLDTTFFRNRVRHNLLPSLMDYNPKIKKILWKTANTLVEDKRALEDEAAEKFKEISTASGTGYRCLDKSSFSNLQTGFQRRVLRQCYSSLRPDIRDIGYDRIDTSMRLLKEPPKSKYSDLFGGLRMWIGEDWFMIYDKGLEVFPHIGPQLGEELSYPISIPGVFEIGNGWVVTTEILLPNSNKYEAIHNNKNDMVAYIDARACPEKIMLRPRVPGERFSPLGMAGQSIKISDYMINEKVPEMARKRWPVVAANEKIIWIPGFQIADEVRVSPKTKEILKIEFTRKKPE